MDEIINYKPKRPSTKWDEIFRRACKHEDDGHCSKLVRALAHGERLCEAHDLHDPSFRIKGDMWLQLGHMGKCFLPYLKMNDFILISNLAIDSVEDDGDTWVRSAGFPQAWEK